MTLCIDFQSILVPKTCTILRDVPHFYTNFERTTANIASCPDAVCFTKFNNSNNWVQRACRDFYKKTDMKMFQTWIYKPRGERLGVCVCVCGTCKQGNWDALPVAVSGLVFNISVIVFKLMSRFPGDVLWHRKATAALSHQTKWEKHWSEEGSVSHQVY